MNDLPEIISVIGTIILMIAVFAGAYFVSKYVGKHYKPGYGTSKHMTIIDSIVIGKDRTLFIVKVGDQAYLIGSTSNAFTLLSEIDVDQLAAEPQAEEPLPKDFITTLREVIKSKTK